MGVGESCPACPPCEQKECPTCPACEQTECPACPPCEDCNTRDYIMDGDKKIQHVNGTPFYITTFVKDITGRRFKDALEEIGDNTVKRTNFLFLLMASDTNYSPTKILIVMVTTDMTDGDIIVYNDKNNYAMLKRLNESLAKIFKQYSSYSFGDIYFNDYRDEKRDPFEIIISAVAGKPLTDQFDKYETISKVSMGDSAKLMKRNEHTGRESPYINSDNTKTVGDLDIRITGVLGNPGGERNYNNLLYVPAENKESFIPYSSGGCLCIVLLIILGIFLFMFLFMREDSPNRKAMDYDTEYRDDI